MEGVSKTTQFKKRRDKLQSIYSRCLLTRKIVLPINFVGKNLNDVIETYIQDNFEGKCVVEGYIKPNSSKIIRYSSGIIERGNKIIFESVFECDICLPVEGMIIPCLVKNVVKAGVRAEVANEEIDKFFGAVENPDNPCGPNKITIQNNVITIKGEDMGKDNSYNPGF